MTEGSQSTTMMYRTITMMPAKIPNNLIGGMSETELAKKAAAVVADVANIEPAACGSAWRIRPTRSLSAQWRSDVRHAAAKTKTSSAPIPKMTKSEMKLSVPNQPTPTTP